MNINTKVSAVTIQILNRRPYRMSLFWKNRLVKTLPWGPGGIRSPQGSCPVVTLSWGTGGRGTLWPPHNSRLTSTSNLHHGDPTGFPQGRHPTRTGSLQAASRHQTAYLWNKEKIGFSLSPFAPESLVSRVRFGCPVPCQPVHSPYQAESGACLRDSTPPFPLSTTVSIRTAMRHRVSAEFIWPCNCVLMAFAAENRPAQGQQFSKVAR